ncbi:formiminotetrahydrofolate cyclodeaminase [mine drainage metagenome]|uniref:Formiminotetrahydrofolate cyclodeaminase n=1 Tax=mine drainage metagenome TaxID=410659 RepID=T1C6R2_9ZZZZ
MSDYNKFIEDLSSSKPAPGGGSASAFVGVISTSLCSMVTALTTGKKNYENVQNEIGKLSEKILSISSEFQELMEEDERAFNMMMEARRLPKDNDESKKFRENEITRTMKEAIRVPWKIAGLCYKTMEIAQKLCTIGNKNAITDAAAAGFLCHAAIESVLLNVRINLKSMKDQKYINSENLKAEIVY